MELAQREAYFAFLCGPYKDAHGAFFPRPAGEALDNELIYRQAYTTYAAAEVVERLQASGLRPARHAAAGNIVFVYRPARTNGPPTPEDGSFLTPTLPSRA